MTRLAPLWQQNGSYPANTDRVLIATLWPTAGVTGGTVTAQANTMNVNVAAGTAAVPLGANYTALCRWDAAEVVTLTAAPPSGQSRIDVIVAQVRDAALDAGGNNDFIFQAIAGTPTTGTPVVPTVPTNALAVAQLTVVGGTANLNGVTVVDRRTPLNPRDPLHARVYRNAAWTTSATWTNVPFDTVANDPAGLWVPANQAFTVPVAGVYMAAGHWGTNATVARHAAFVSIGKNAVQQLDGSFVISVAAGDALGTMTAGTMVCAAGDRVSLLHLGNPTSPGFTGIGGCWMTLDYLGTG